MHLLTVHTIIFTSLVYLGKRLSSSRQWKWQPRTLWPSYVLPTEIHRYIRNAQWHQSSLAHNQHPTILTLPPFSPSIHFQDEHTTLTSKYIIENSVAVNGCFNSFFFSFFRPSAAPSDSSQRSRVRSGQEGPSLPSQHLGNPCWL